MVQRQSRRRFGGDRAKVFLYYNKYDKPCGLFDMLTLKRELEEYITYRAAANRIPRWGYFRVDYDDDASGERLKLFIKKSLLFGKMQAWNIIGICRAADWTEELEDEGRIRGWYEESVELPDKNDGFQDWVMRERTQRVLQNTSKTLHENVLKEVLNEFNNERDKRDATDVAFVQSVFFDFRGRRKIKVRP
jgi:hypothetical protein